MRKMSDQIQQIAERIAGLRDIAGFSVEELAQELGISVEEYRRYESGEVDIPIGFLYKLANKYNVELTAILTGEEPKLRTYCLVRKGKGVSVDRRTPYKYHSLAYNFINKRLSRLKSALSHLQRTRRYISAHIRARSSTI